MPTAINTYTSIEKYRFASSRLPSPSAIDTTALPPVPIRKPTVPIPMSSGIIRLIAANEVLPAKLETKKPSTTLYIDVNTIIIIDGNTKRNSFV